MTCADLRVAGEELGDPLGVVAVPVHPDASVLSPRRVSQAVERSRRRRPSRSGGSRPSPRARGRVRRARRRRRRSGRRRTWWCECTTTSAPSASGCWRYGDANVLSTTSSAPASCATAASASMSPMLSSGLVGRLDPDQLGPPGPDRGADRVDVVDRCRAVLEAPRQLRPCRTAGRCRRTRRPG